MRGHRGLAGGGADPLPGARGGLTAELRDSIAAVRDALLPLLPDAPDHVGRLTGEQIEDFRRYGVEVRLRLASGLEFWLVSAYTMRNRAEPTPEDLEWLATVWRRSREQWWRRGSDCGAE